jgi:protein TonB
MQAVLRKIDERWDRRAPAAAEPRIVVEIGKDGQLLDVALEKSSGDALYDEGAVRAIINAAPFPPLPTEYDKPLLRFWVEFRPGATSR